jgi:hypothetical protein
MKVIRNCHVFSKKRFLDSIINYKIIYLYNFYFFKDISIPETTIDAHSLPSSPSSTTCREQKQRRHYHSPICKFSSITISFFLSLLSSEKKRILVRVWYHQLYSNKNDRWATAEIDMRYFYK